MKILKIDVNTIKLYILKGIKNNKKNENIMLT